jgi:hypothetical protein
MYVCEYDVGSIGRYLLPGGVAVTHGDHFDAFVGKGQIDHFLDRH